MKVRFKIVGQPEPEAVEISVIQNPNDGDVQIHVDGNMVAYFDKLEDTFVVWRSSLDEAGLGFRED